MRFPIVIHKDDNSEFGVIVPDLPGCFSAGETYDETVDSAREAIECHIEGLLLDQEVIPLPKALDEHITNPDYKDGIWAFIDIDFSEVAGKAVRVNITLPDKVLMLVDLFVKNHTVKNRSSFITDATLAYIAGSENKPHIRKRNTH